MDSLGKNYVIAWASKLTTASGQGTTRFTFKEAQEICEAANKKHPALSHIALPWQKMSYGRLVPR